MPGYARQMLWWFVMLKQHLEKFDNMTTNAYASLNGQTVELKDFVT
jgi:hypothetical protein